MHVPVGDFTNGIASLNVNNGPDFIKVDDKIGGSAGELSMAVLAARIGIDTVPRRILHWIAPVANSVGVRNIVAFADTDNQVEAIVRWCCGGDVGRRCSGQRSDGG